MTKEEMNRDHYKIIIMQDIEWLKEYTNSSIEHRHIIDVLKESIDLLYPPKPESEGGADD